MLQACRGHKRSPVPGLGKRRRKAPPSQSPLGACFAKGRRSRVICSTCPQVAPRRNCWWQCRPARLTTAMLSSSSWKHLLLGRTQTKSKCRSAGTRCWLRPRGASDKKLLRDRTTCALLEFMRSVCLRFLLFTTFIFARLHFLFACDRIVWFNVAGDSLVGM